MDFVTASIADHLSFLYGEERGANAASRLEGLLREASTLCSSPPPTARPVTQRDAMLIAYPDQLHEPGKAPLATLKTFVDRQAREIITAIHLLPFFPSSSDDGFAVTDYLEVDPRYGTWDDVRALAENYRLVVDAVLNHASARGRWFAGFLRGDDPWRGYFLTPDPFADWSRVVRPRTSSLFTPFETAAGPASVWTTFSPDQVDLNYANPDFDAPPPAPDDVSAQLPAALGLDPAQPILLQPTRVVPRKRIELAIELTRRLGSEATLVVSHAAGDEGSAYEAHLRNYADMIGAHVIFAADIFAPERRLEPGGRQVFSLADAYQQARLVTYPSTVEGFGNAFIETLYYRCPLVMSRYEIFRADIAPKGFHVVGIDDFVTDEAVEEARRLLDNPSLAAEMTERNYELGRRFYSFRTLERRLALLLQDTLGTETEDDLFASW